MDLSLIPPTVILAVFLVLIFIIGACLGSLLNVCIYRIPYEKSIVWPSSRCGKCYQPIRWYDNIPLISYWLLWGRCRRCGERFSIRYFLIELMTGLGFVGLFYLEVVANPRGPELFGEPQLAIAFGLVGWMGYVWFAFHALLLCFLIVLALTDIDHMEIPLSVTLTGTVVGLIGSGLFPWPWPAQLSALSAAIRPGTIHVPILGLYPWPVWYPLPEWLPPRSPLTGLATGFAGVLAGMAVPRVIGFLFKAGRGKEGLGIGDADLMMMVGAFLGWQVVVMAFFISVLPALLFGIAQLLIRGDRPMPFGPSLALGTVITWVGWRWIGPAVEGFFFDPLLVGMVAVVGCVGLFGISWLMWLIRPPDRPEPPPEAPVSESSAEAPAGEEKT